MVTKRYSADVGRYQVRAPVNMCEWCNRRKATTTATNNGVRLNVCRHCKKDVQGT